MNIPNPTLRPAFVYLLLVVAGAIQTLNYAPFDVWLIGPLSVLLILWATKALDYSATGKPFRYGWFYGLGLFGAGVTWVYVSINTYGNASPPLAGGLTLVFVAGLALFQGFQFWLFYKIRTRYTTLNALVFLVVWLMSDAFRTDFLTGFPWLFLGYGHLNSPLSGWAPVVGVYGITAIVVASALVIYLLAFERRSKTIIASVVAVAACWVTGAFLKNTQWTQNTNNTQSIALLQLNIPQNEKWRPEQRRKTIHLLTKLSHENWDKDIIFWPETAVPLLFDQAKPVLRQIERKATETDTNIITGIPFRERKPTGDTVLHNSIYSFGEGEGLYHKQKLVPFGEYVPLQDLLRGLIDFFDLPMSDFRPGPAQQALLKSQGFKVAPFICYEVVYPDFVAEGAADADYLLTISNDAWFGESIGPLQHLQMAQMRALENGRYMVRATNNGVTAVINEKGQITAQSEQFIQTVLETELEIFEGRTPYSLVKSTPLFLVSTGLLFFFVLVRRRWQNEEEKS